MSAELFIMCGLPFSGKSFLSKKISEHKGAKRISFDQRWIEVERLLGVGSNSLTWRYLVDIVLNETKELLSTGQAVVYDSTNTRKEHRDEFRKIADDLGLKTTIIFLNIPLEELKRREVESVTKGDHHAVDEEKFQNALDQLEPPTNEEPFKEFTQNMDVADFLKSLN